MLQEVITYKEIGISLCNILDILELVIEEHINEHSTLKLTAILSEEMKAEVIHELDEVLDVFYCKNGMSKSLFQGRVTTINISTIGELYELKIEALSYTYGLDITRKSRSFQDINMTTHEVITSIMRGYPGNDCILQIPNEPIGELVVQYQETDWEFIRRFVSRYQEGLYCDNGYSATRFYAGRPALKTQVNWDDLEYEVSKQMADFHGIQANDIEDMTSQQYIVYKVRAYDYLELGTTVNYKNKSKAISQIKRCLEAGELVSYYSLQQQGSLRKKHFYNERMTGVSIDGQILEVKRNKVKVHLTIDDDQEINTAYWFPYSTVSSSSGGSGWYCMPEVGESVRAYFPVHNEKEGYVITNIKSHTPEAPQDGDMMSDPTNKNISTAQDKQVLFTSEGVFIIANSGKGQVNLKLDGTVEVSGIEDITFNAVEDIAMRAEQTVSISANKNIDILNESEGHVEIKIGGNMYLSAKEIYEN